MPLGAPLVMADDEGEPFHGLRIEPAVGIEKVTIDTTVIGLDPVQISNPSYAGFDYNGGFSTASYLAKAALEGEGLLYVNDPSQYEIGDRVYISDLSTDPEAYLLPVDRPMEVRQVLYKTGTALGLRGRCAARTRSSPSSASAGPSGI